MPSDHVQIIAQIRFALARLSERNAHHEWEHVCRHLTHERICSNILPATGPVQSGGDQGRDFESFHTYLSQSSLAGQSFVGLIADRPIAFACTLEQSIVTKIHHDVQTIMAGGIPVDRIYIFCTSGVAVAKRHELQDWTQKTYGVNLEILDGEAIAELLSNGDIFWIAERYLELPANLLPDLSEADAQDWYTAVLDKWRRATSRPQTFADLTEIQMAARTALGPFTYDEGGRPINRYERPELPFWIERMDEMADHAAIDTLRRRAFYQASVLRLRGLNTLIGQEERLRRYFSGIPRLKDAADLEDIETLFTYIFTASRQGLAAITDVEVRAWREALESRIDERLYDAEQHGLLNTHCMLLEVRGHLALFHHIDQGTMDLDGALTYWSQLVQLAKQTPLFPLERFADRLTQYARFLGVHPSYEPLTQAVDTILAERFGHIKAAEKCLDRAQAFYQAGDVPRAMAQLHRAKVDWFAEETLGKALYALSWLSHTYTEQGLFFAAKYYALAAAFIALQSRDAHLKPIVARSLASAASCDYAMGAWYGFLELAEVSAVCHRNLTPQLVADNELPHWLQGLLFHLSLLPTVTERFYSESVNAVRERCMHIARWLGLDDVMEALHAQAEAVWARDGDHALWEKIEEHLAGEPWSDAGPTHRVEWKAYGVKWNVQWTNDYETTLAAEGFLAALQVVLSDLAGADLCLMRSTLRLTIRLAEDIGPSPGSGYRGFDIRFEPSNQERRAVISLPPYSHFRDGALTYEDLQIGAISITNYLLTEVSLLSTQQFDQIVESQFAHGLSHKLHIGAPYARCLGEFIMQDEFDASARKAGTGFTAPEPFVSHYPQALPWCDAPGPGYDLETACEYITNRYRRFARPIRRTLKRLTQEPSFQRTVAQLRTEGWKDWHLLSAVFHVTMNYRMNHRTILLSAEAEKAANRRLVSQPEPNDALPVPLSEYTEENLRFQIKPFMNSFAQTFGLELHQITPDFPALEDFLAHRYHFWSDDSDHRDPFVAS
jgi:hypothetical protein